MPIQDAATEIGVSEVTLYRYLKVGRLKRWKRPMEQRTYLDRDELRQLLEFRVVEGSERGALSSDPI